VWPKCFLKKRDGIFAHYSPVSGKVHGADYVVRDVCEVCNNQKLSYLDAYFCLLNDKYFCKPADFGGKVHFEYDYDLLARSLLKISYNAARSASSETEPFLGLISYILEGKTKQNDFAVVAELVSPSRIRNSDETTTIVHPTMYRSALSKLLTPNGEASLLRLVAINSFFFHILLRRKVASSVQFGLSIKELLKNVAGTVLMDPDCKAIDLATSPQDSLSSMLPLLKAKNKEYGNYFRSKKKIKS
jgi:hypothetical protein